ncbi:MAG: hypothetical protein K9G60_05580 [Pseudolabrys sp.]|nr:hypothetical protein [Pseudolabrys sp.]
MPAVAIFSTGCGPTDGQALKWTVRRLRHIRRVETRRPVSQHLQILDQANPVATVKCGR